MAKEIVTRPHLQNMVAWAADKPEVLVLSADLTSSCEADGFREAYPDRFFSLGMAEQNMMGFAGGLAREGFEPFIHTFAVFITRRPFDQVAMSIAYPNLPVRLLGFLPGLTTPGGVTHQAIDDVALMRVIPNMTVLECGDATEVESVLDVAHGVDGPVYVRMLRGEVPRLFPATSPMRLGEVRQLGESDGFGLITSGICTEEGLRAAEVMRRRGLAVAHLHLATLKPFPAAEVADFIAGTRRGVITMENHSVIGGLGSAVAETMAEAGLGDRRLRRLGVQDTYAHGASREALMGEYGLDARAVVTAAAELLGEAIDVDDAELTDEDEPTAATDEGRVEDL